MSNGHHPSTAGPTGRASKRLRVAADSRATAARFGQPSDGIRLVALGVFLIALATLAIANTALGSKADAYSSGMASTFGGLLLAIIVIRMSRSALYFDWIGVGLLHGGLGLLSSKDPSLLAATTFAFFTILLAASALLRIWIGATHEASSGTASLAAGGLCGLFCTVWAIAGRVMGVVTDAGTILSVDLLVLGMSVVGFGFYVLRRRQ
jgi:uncharacterized membrane protein HdeD (DUF308 family)